MTSTGIYASMTDDMAQTYDSSSCYKSSSEHCSKSRRIIKYLIASLIILSSLALCFTYFRISNSEQKLSSSELTPTQSSFIQTDYNFHLILDSNTIFPSLTPSKLLSTSSITLLNPLLTSFDTSPFHNLHSLSIAPSLRLENLVINNSQLTQFIYSSSELKSLKLINNTKLTSFLNSSLPSLQTLLISKTPITTFTNNKFYNLSSVQFINSQISTLHLFDVKIQSLLIQNCAQIDTIVNSFSAYHNVQQITVKGTKFTYDVKFENMSHLKSISLYNNTFNKDIIVHNCTHLQEFNFQNKNVSKLVLSYLPNLFFFFPVIHKAEDIFVQFTNIHEFVIETSSLYRLFLSGPQTKRIQENIPGLKVLQLKQNALNDSQFSLLYAPDLTMLTIQNCFNLHTLNNTFNQLITFYIIDMKLLNFSTLDAPKLYKLQIQKGEYDIIDTKPFQELQYFILIQSSVTSSIILSNKISFLLLQHNRNKFDLTFTGSSLQTIQIVDSNINSISNNNFSQVVLFQMVGIEEKDVTITNNTFSQNLLFFKIYFVETPLIEDNVFSLKSKTEVNISSCSLSEIKQEFKGVQIINLSNNTLNDFEDLNDKIEGVLDLDESNNEFETICDQNNTDLIKLSLRELNLLINFSNNNFSELVELDLQNCKVLKEFEENQFPNLDIIDLRFCQQLGEKDILKEFKRWKEIGTNLKLVVLDEWTEEFEVEVTELFQNVKIVKERQ